MAALLRPRPELQEPPRQQVVLQARLMAAQAGMA
jgi:hypothetical protein